MTYIGSNIQIWIAEFDSINPNIGYNRTIGGPGTIGYVFTEQDLKKKSENRKGTNIVDGSIVSFDSIADATRFILTKRSGKYTTVISHIRNSIVGYQSSKGAYGYIWEYIEKSNDYLDRE